MRRILTAAGALAVMVALTAAAGASTPDHATTATALATQQDPGKALFEGKGNCFSCHGKNAKGTPLAPDLTDTTWIHFDGQPTLQQLETLIKNGVAEPKQHPAPMPPMGGASLSDEQIAQLAKYVLSLSAGSSGS